MKAFLMTLLISVVATVVLWTFGLARLMFPAHPMMATTAITAIAAILTQAVYTRHAGSALRK